MADKVTIARPYARAAFEEARTHAGLEGWSEGLQLAASVVQDGRVAALLGNPRVTPAELARLVTGIAGGKLGEAGANFIELLAVNRRLGCLPEIATLFDTFKDEAQGVAHVTVTSATPLDAPQRESLTQALERRLERRVRLHCVTDPQLIGGAVLRSGDLVIDGSLRTQLERIAYQLTA
ncbi:MAG TPA: F0F1 ATP synthase subunit delta [Steroidobacteraceae bacterium]|nr:F0F1 ATP synthase subunit delta [Steroidobacteraceae bacterium]